MRRLLIIAAAVLIGLALPAASRADGMPKLQVKERAKVKTVRHMRHRLVRRAPAVFALPGPYDLHAEPPNPLDGAYQPAMMSYFRDPSITGYRPGSAAGYVLAGVVETVGSTHYHRIGWGGAQGPKLPPPPRIDNFPFRKYPAPAVLEYDGLIGEYVPLSARDATLAMQVSRDKPVPLWPIPPR